jgi:two-component system, chemotaxis family, protein-glutamate methylesterase/glutaminase
MSSGQKYEIVALASSAGGLKALSELLSGLPADLNVSVVAVQHMDRHHPSMLDKILTKKTGLRVKQAEEGESLCNATVYIAPPDKHLVVNADHSLSLSDSALIQYVRPCADVLFRSVATAFGSKAIAVVLTGTGSDGAAGIDAIKEMGGTVIVQDEATSEYSGMPKAAMRTGHVDFILPLDRIATTLNELCKA